VYYLFLATIEGQTMEPKDLASIAISIIAALISLASIIIASRLVKKQASVQAWITNHQLLNTTAGMLIANQDLLKILGIEPEEIAKDGITPSEIVFIITSLDASSARQTISGNRRVTLTEFRKNFLRNDKVRTAWKKYLKDKTFDSSPWTEAVDAYIADFESTENASQTKKA
jgi:hypothetical protein